jgi:hypothetical protein
MAKKLIDAEVEPSIVPEPQPEVKSFVQPSQTKAVYVEPVSEGLVGAVAQGMLASGKPVPANFAEQVIALAKKLKGEMVK